MIIMATTGMPTKVAMIGVLNSRGRFTDCAPGVLSARADEVVE
jgi:hypothetical protein